MTNHKQSFVHDPHTTITNEETCSSNSEAFASELPENPEEMFHLHYMFNILFSKWVKM